MNNLEKLQDILNACIAVWWKPRWYELWYDLLSLKYYQSETIDNGPGFEIKLSYSPSYRVSANDLFSVESWLMEFVGWKDKMESIYWTRTCRNASFNSWVCSPINADYHYMIMWPMTANEKIQQFINNATIPWAEK